MALGPNPAPTRPCTAVVCAKGMINVNSKNNQTAKTQSDASFDFVARKSEDALNRHPTPWKWHESESPQVQASEVCVGCWGAATEAKNQSRRVSHTHRPKREEARKRNIFFLKKNGKSQFLDNVLLFDGCSFSKTTTELEKTCIP